VEITTAERHRPGHPDCCARKEV